jgi:hypothetical protein|tara:strand:- start:7762 stop:8673 length:912 start_codon:yes stop_codon:yes gene_type:complete
MAQEYSFTQQERNNLFAPSKVYSSFGRDALNDFVMLHVYDTNGNLIVTKVLSLNEVSFENDGDFIDINVGQHLRDLGFQEGEYDVVYKFLRRLAGRERTVFVDGNNNIFNGEVQRKVIANEIKFFKGGDEEKDTSLREEVFIKEYKYPLVETSPDRTEFILELDNNLNGSEYRNDFVEMGEMIEYTPISKANMGSIEFDSKKPHILEFDIDPTDRGFTQNMVGGQIIIPNMYKITGEEDTNNSDVVPENTGNGTLQQQLEGGAATDFLDLTNEELIDILKNDPDPNERELADGALQERANEQR